MGRYQTLWVWIPYIEGTYCTLWVWLLHTVGVVTVYCGYIVGVDTMCSAVPSNLSVKVASVLVL